jgi:GXGXG motif-containing protein
MLQASQAFKIDEKSTRNSSPKEFAYRLADAMAGYDYGMLDEFLQRVRRLAEADNLERAFYLETLTLLNDLRYSTGDKKRASVLTMIRECLHDIFRVAATSNGRGDNPYRRLDWQGRDGLGNARLPSEKLVVDAADFPPEGPDSLARLVVSAYHRGWRNLILYNVRGQRFVGSGLGMGTEGLRLDVYGSSGDYLASGLAGASVYTHDNAQDQVANIMKSGMLVIYGDVGQTFMYGAKGGEAYVMGNTAGRPVVFSVGKPRLVINGTALDYLCESFMAGDPLNGGGFAVLNGVGFNEQGRIIELETPYPGGNLFSLSSGGAVYIRDPGKLVGEDQLNGGRLAELSDADWGAILPYLKKNEELFRIPIQRLLTVDGVVKSPREMYRKVEPAGSHELKTGHS